MDEILVALQGNPNVGKSTVFNTLTGMRQHVGNWPGKTVERKEGFRSFRGKMLKIVDLPGTYSLAAYSTEETIARDFIIHGNPDVVVNVVDASNLERNLYLTLQTLEVTERVVIALNMMDVAEAKGFTIDIEELSELLGVSVVPMVADKRRGVDDLLSAMVDLAEGRMETRRFTMDYGPQLEKLLTEIEEFLKDADLSGHNPRWVAVKLLENDPEAVQVTKGLRELEGFLQRITVSQTT